MNRRRALQLLVSLALVMVLNACNGDDSTATPTEPSLTPEETLTAPAPATEEPELTPTAEEATPTPDETTTETSTPEASRTPPRGRLPMQIINYSTPVTPGQAAFITVKAKPGSKCFAVLEYSREKASGPPRLKAKEVDAQGVVDWVWRIQQKEPQEILVTATCDDGSERGNRQFVIEVMAG